MLAIFCKAVGAHYHYDELDGRGAGGGGEGRGPFYSCSLLSMETHYFTSERRARVSFKCSIFEQEEPNFSFIQFNLNFWPVIISL
jgi:hypothetical protein